VATLAITDDALGTNTLGLAGEDAGLFEIDGTTLFLKAGVALDHAVTPQLDVTVELDDAALGAGPEDSVALVIEVPDTDQSGTSGDDLLIGTPYDDRLFGLAGNDTLVGRESDDLLDGGDDHDVAVFQAPQESYTITLSPGAITVADRTPGGTGTDTVIDIETLRFAGDPVGAPGVGEDLDLTLFDGVLDVTLTQLKSLTHLYIGLFDRAPDALGLLYWATQLEGGMTYEEITQEFIDSPEAIAIYGAAPTNAEIVEKAYENLLDRASDPTGAAFWTELLDEGKITPADFFEKFVEGAARNPSAGDDRETLADQVDISLYFSLIKGLSNVPNAATALGTYDITDRATSLMDAQDLIDDYATTATGLGAGGELIVQVTGIIDDPFAMV
jgi:Ca2+-binding RTX toxin-like protein